MLAMSAPEGIRTPNLLIRSQMLYPLSYGRNSVPDRSPVHCGRSGDPLANHVRDYMMQSGAANPRPSASGEQSRVRRGFDDNDSPVAERPVKSLVASGDLSRAQRGFGPDDSAVAEGFR